MIRALFAATVALALAASFVGPAAAQVDVSDLVVSSSDNRDGASATFPEGTTDLYVVFDYSDATNHRIGVKLMGLGLPKILLKDDVYRGNGQAAVPISGTEIYQSLATQLHSDAGAAESSAGLASNQATGRMEYLSQTQASVNKMQLTLTLMGAVGLATTQDRLLQQVEADVDALNELVGDALEPGLSDEERKARAEALMTPAGDVKSSAKALKDDAAGVADLALPPTGQSEYNVQLTINGNPASSTDFQVTDAQGTPGANASDNPEPTKTPSGGVDATSTPVTSRGPSNVRPRTPVTGAAEPTKAADADDEAGDESAQDDAPKAAAQDSSDAASGSVAPQNDAQQPAGAAATVPPSGGAPVVAERDAGVPEGTVEGVGQDLQQGSSAAGAENVAAPTWTVPALAQGGEPPAPVQPVAGDGGDPTGGSSGPNLGFLAIGAVVLVGVALWLRSRM